MNAPQMTARIAGFFWLMTFVFGGVAMSTAGKLVVEGDAAATAANILANERMFLFGGLSNVIATLCYVAVTLFIYELFKNVNQRIALLATFFSLIGCAIGAFSSFFDFAPLVLLKGDYAEAESLALLAVQLRMTAGSIGFVFFAFHCLLTGVLILRSAFVPRVVGALMVLAGIGWATFLWPPLSTSLFPYNAIPGMLGEGTLTLWLLVMGVNVDRWREQAGTNHLQHAVV